MDIELGEVWDGSLVESGETHEFEEFGARVGKYECHENVLELQAE